jgi:hypothetical protein
MNRLAFQALLLLIGAGVFIAVLWMAVVEQLVESGRCGTPLRVEAC